MSVQTSYSINHAAVYAGMMLSFQPHNTISKLNKGVTSIPYGSGVVTDGDNGAALPTSAATAAQFNGVAMYELNRAQVAGAVGAVAGYDFTVVAHGQVAVVADLDVNKDDPVYFIVSDGTGTKQGGFSNVIGATATLAVLLPDAKWIDTTLAGKVGFISLGIGG